MAQSDYITCPHCGRVIGDVGEGEMRKDLHNIAVEIANDKFKVDGYVKDNPELRPLYLHDDAMSEVNLDL